MSELEKMEAYIRKTKIKEKTRRQYGLCFDEIEELGKKGRETMNDLFDVIVLAFEYGTAKGYRAGKKEAGRG